MYQLTTFEWVLHCKNKQATKQPQSFHHMLCLMYIKQDCFSPKQMVKTHLLDTMRPASLGKFITPIGDFGVTVLFRVTWVISGKGCICENPDHIR